MVMFTCENKNSRTQLKCTTIVFESKQLACALCVCACIVCACVCMCVFVLRVCIVCVLCVCVLCVCIVCVYCVCVLCVCIVCVYCVCVLCVSVLCVHMCVCSQISFPTWICRSSSLAIFPRACSNFSEHVGANRGVMTGFTRSLYGLLTG